MTVGQNLSRQWEVDSRLDETGIGTRKKKRQRLDYPA